MVELWLVGTYVEFDPQHAVPGAAVLRVLRPACAPASSLERTGRRRRSTMIVNLGAYCSCEIIRAGREGHAQRPDGKPASALAMSRAAGVPPHRAQARRCSGSGRRIVEPGRDRDARLVGVLADRRRGRLTFAANFISSRNFRALRDLFRHGRHLPAARDRAALALLIRGSASASSSAGREADRPRDPDGPVRTRFTESTVADEFSTVGHRAQPRGCTRCSGRCCSLIVAFMFGGIGRHLIVLFARDRQASVLLNKPRLAKVMDLGLPGHAAPDAAVHRVLRTSRSFGVEVPAWLAAACRA